MLPADTSSAGLLNAQELCVRARNAVPFRRSGRDGNGSFKGGDRGNREQPLLNAVPPREAPKLRRTARMQRKAQGGFTASLSLFAALLPVEEDSFVQIDKLLSENRGTKK